MLYLASPYSHPDEDVREQRFIDACAASSFLMKRGELVFSPICHSHPIAQFGLPKGWDFWEKYDREFLEFCSSMVVLMLDGWQESKGVQAEIQIMKEMGKPITHLDPKEYANRPDSRK